MRIEGANKRRICLAIALAGLVVAGALAITWYLNGDEEASVEGGQVLNQDSDCLTVRCLSPDVSVNLNGFSGQVVFTNCFADAQVLGHEEDAVKNGTRISLSVPEDVKELRLSTPQKESFKFVVLGDSQGKNDILAQILDSIEGCEFIIHCGDLTPSGAESEFNAVQETFDSSGVPVFTTPGNHDARLGLLGGYEKRFGRANYAFTYSGVSFAFLDSSDQSISERELELAKEAFGDAETKIMVTHMPSYDPFDLDHTLDAASCNRVQTFALDNGLSGVYTGHIHAFYMLEVEGTAFMITGGAGATLVDGEHHHVVVTADDGDLSYEKVDLVTDWTMSPHVSLTGREGQTLNLTFDDLLAMESLSAYSSYENLYGNIGGEGVYSGPSVAALMDLVGGMEEGDVLRVVASDGYAQEFGYLNAYTSEEWFAFQGMMVLAMTFDDETVPDWPGGPRLAFLAPDGLYGNYDCEETSYEDQGYYLYPSAGSRWVGCVSSITVEAGA